MLENSDRISTVALPANRIDRVASQPIQTQKQTHWRQRLLRETRTRILIAYTLVMAGVTALSIPLFMTLFLHNVDQRVRQDLQEEMEAVQEMYETWKADPRFDHDLKNFAAQVLGSIEPEDDNSLIFYIDGKYYISEPEVLPPELSQGSAAEAHWQNLTALAEGQQETDNPQLGSIIYLVQPLEIGGKQRGIFVAVHATAGEREEALDGIAIFMPIMAGVFVIGLGLAWLITGKLLKPVQELSITARSISETDLSRRITIDGSGELAELAVTFNSMMNRLQDAFTSQRNFVNDAGHELRTPITIIQGYIDLLDDVPLEVTETIKIVQDELDRMGRLVNDMILLAKSERPDFLHLETIEIVPFVEELLYKAQTLADRDWQLKQRGQGVVVADRQRLTGALLNLLSNAAQHTQTQDLIELGVIIQKQQVRFWVRDCGEGIPLAEQNRIFERFARVAHTSRRSEGSGLGLAIVQAIVEAHNGRVELASKPGYGSTFTLVLPLDPL